MKRMSIAVVTLVTLALMPVGAQAHSDIVIGPGAYAPAVYRVEMGHAVAWENMDPLGEGHSVSPDHETGELPGFAPLPFDSNDPVSEGGHGGLILPGESWGFTTTEMGNFAYVCVHGDSHDETMRGVLVVTHTE